MAVIFKSKIPPWADVFPQIENIIANPSETPFCVGIPYGLQLQKEIWNPEKLRVVLHVNTASGHRFLSHHGVGKKNEINIWNFSKEKQPVNSENALQTFSTDLKFLHILFAQRRWIYVMYCTDLSLRIFSAKFHPVSTTAVNKTVLSLAYNEIRDEIITGIAGGIMTWKFPTGQTDPLTPGQLISCSFTPFDWVMSLTIDNTSKQILAISDVRISMIDIATHKERCSFEKKCDFSFTTCVFYSPASYFITGDKNGSVRAWSMSLNSFPMVTQFLGHTAEITKLLVHPSEPLLVSSSLDKTIRIWNFDTCAQTFKLETVEEIIDMELLSNDLLYYRSDHHVKIWSLNLFHSLFTVLSSRIRRWSRVKSPGYPARILVHAEDGGVRLVSPVHGYELTTVLPITTMTADIVDVAHNPRQEKIYLVLSTREVLVFESDTNPCCAYQLWAAESPEEGVCSLAMINSEFALDESSNPLKSGLLFAGHFNGQISLISGKDVYMKDNVQAHQGQVTFLRVSASFTKSNDSLAAKDHLVSCGTDRTVRIWQLINPELNRVSIQQKALVKLLQLPRDLAMAGDTLCMAMADNNVVMCRVRAEEKQCGANIFNKTKKTYEFLTHSKDEGHIAPINGLSCCSTLRLFATSSEDCSVKIWNCDNQLVREMSFDESLCGVCFANSRGDILVSFQSQISLVTILNYLPLSYLEIVSKMHFDNDPFEDHVQFDDLLKFWYDPARVPRIPLEASKRRPLEPPEVKRPKKKRKKETVTIKPKQEDEEDLDLFQKRRRSRRLSTQVHVMMALRRLLAKSSRSSLSDAVNAMTELVKEEPEANGEPQEKALAPTVLDEEEAAAEVYWPCAPDGFIPNSVVRKRITPKRPRVRRIPRITRPELQQEKPVKEEEEEEEEEEEDEDNHQFKPKITDFWTLWKSTQAAHLREKMSKESSKKKKQKEGRKRRKVSQSASSSLRRKLPPRPRAARSEGPLMEFEEEEEEEEQDKEMEYGTEEEEELEPNTEEEEVSDASPESSHGWSGSELLETPEESLQESEGEEDLYFEDIDESQSSPSETESTKSVMKLEITSSELPLLSQIVRKDWYPKLAQRRRDIPNVGDVIDNMLKVLPKMNSFREIQDICEEFMNVEREFGIPEDKKLEIQNLLIKLSYSEKAGNRQAAVWALGEMKVHREDAYLTVVRRLVDTDKGTREEAKKVLKTLTGVDTMEGLSGLIMNAGVVHLQLPSNDNAVLMELAVRLRQEKSKRQENMEQEAEADKDKEDSFDNLRTTLRRRPFKAKFKHPKTMDRRLRDTTRTGRRPSVFDEPASLSNTGRFKKALKESKLGCKLLQKMEPFGLEIAKSFSEPTSSEAKEAKSLEIGGRSLTPSQCIRQGEELSQLTASSSKESRVIPATLSRQFSSKASVVLDHDVITPVKSSDRLTITREGETTKETTATPGWILLERGRTSWKCDTDQATEGLRSTELLSLKQIIQVMNCVSGLSQNSNMLQLLKMKRTKKIIPQNIALEDGSVQQFYGVGDLLEAICRLPPVSTFLAQLARKTSKSKEKILINMRGIFRPGCLITIEKGDFVVVNGLGRLPLKCQDTLMTFRDSVLQNIERFLGNFESLTSGDEELTRTFTSPLEGILWLCAILEPEMEVKGLFSVSQEGVQYIGPRTSLASYASRKRSEPEFPPIFLQPSLQCCVGPGTRGQRLLDSTLIRTRALSDSRLQSSKRKAKDFVVTSLPHRLSTHTGKQLEGKSQFGIMELTWRAGTPLRQLNEGTPYNCETGNLPQISSKPVELKEPFMLKNDQGKTNFKPHISKPQSVPPLSHRKLKPFVEKKLNFFRAVNNLNKQDSPVALDEYNQNQNIIKKKFLDEKGNLLRGSFTDHPPPPKPATPISFHASPALPSLNKESMTSVRSGNSSGRCLRFYEFSRGLTRDFLLSELNKFHLPTIFKDGRQNRSP